MARAFLIARHADEGTRASSGSIGLAKHVFGHAGGLLVHENLRGL